MVGEKTDKEKLNNTLEVVVNILHEEDINDWFIFFGTLLGIIREDSCIQGDDDFDIMINIALGLEPLWENAIGKNWKKTITREKLKSLYQKM